MQTTPLHLVSIASWLPEYHRAVQTYRPRHLSIEQFRFYLPERFAECLMEGALKNILSCSLWVRNDLLDLEASQFTHEEGVLYRHLEELFRAHRFPLQSHFSTVRCVMSHECVVILFYHQELRHGSF